MKVREKDLEAIIADILTKLKERFNLIEYDKMTGPVFVTHIFLEEATDIRVIHKISFYEIHLKHYIF